MKKFTAILPAALLAASFAFAAPTSAQGKADFRPYKGICWGMFWDQAVENMFADMVPVEYVRPAWDKYVLVDFLGCGRDLSINIVNEGLEEGYYDIELEMDGGLYDDYGYFYPPFNSGDYKYSFTAPNSEIVGPILQPYSYYHDPLEYIGLFYVRYPQTEFCYLDVKLSEDYYEDSPRTYIEEEETDGIASIAASAALAKTYYDFKGRRVEAGKEGLTIENGRKVIR